MHRDCCTARISIILVHSKFGVCMTNLDLSDLTVAVILPAYNEELTIEETIRDFHKQLPDAYFLVVNNNSTDLNSYHKCITSTS